MKYNIVVYYTDDTSTTFDEALAFNFDKGCLFVKEDEATMVVLNMNDIFQVTLEEVDEDS